MIRNIASDLKFEIEYVCGGCGSGVAERSEAAELEQPEQIAERNVTESPEAELPNVVRQRSWRAWSVMECSKGVEAAHSCSC